MEHFVLVLSTPHSKGLSSRVILPPKEDLKKLDVLETRLNAAAREIATMNKNQRKCVEAGVDTLKTEGDSIKNVLRKVLVEGCLRNACSAAGRSRPCSVRIGGHSL